MLRVLFAALFLSFPLLISAAPVVIGIAGGTGSGKTTLAKKIQESLAPNVVLIEQDCYYKDLSHLSYKERYERNFDHPDSIDFDCFCKDILDLKEGNAINKPIYSFCSHTRMTGSTPITTADVIIVEGILIFTEERMRNLLDLKVYVQTDDDVRILRRIKRDIKERGRNFESIYQQYLMTVKPMHNQFVEPSKRFADVIIPGHSDTSAAVSLILDGLRTRDSCEVGY